MEVLQGILLGLFGWFVVRCVIGGFYVVNQAQRAVKTSFGRAQRLGNLTTIDDPVSEGLSEDERGRYRFPQMKVILPGGPYFKWPWERIHKVSVATITASMAWDPEDSSANQGGASLEAVTKDQLNTGLTGQIRYRISDRNLYAYLFGVKKPIAHVMGYFVSILRERIANVSNATVRCLSNMPLAEMLENRHQMSQTVRDEVTEKSSEWGYKVGSVYIRKVHFRDAGMIKQIEEKVVNQLRQVTAAIKQDGANQVSIITSTAEREAAIEFAKAAAFRPKIVGEALQEISQDPEIEQAMFEILENEKMIEGDAHVTMIPQGNDFLARLLTMETPARQAASMAASEALRERGLTTR